MLFCAERGGPSREGSVGVRIATSAMQSRILRAQFRITRPCAALKPKVCVECADITARATQITVPRIPRTDLFFAHLRSPCAPGLANRRSARKEARADCIHHVNEHRGDSRHLTYRRLYGGLAHEWIMRNLSGTKVSVALMWRSSCRQTPLPGCVTKHSNGSSEAVWKPRM
jgi:hypothetical protein